MVIKPVEGDSTPGTVNPVLVSLVSLIEPVAYLIQLDTASPIVTMEYSGHKLRLFVGIIPNIVRGGHNHRRYSQFRRQRKSVSVSIEPSYQLLWRVDVSTSERQQKVVH